MNYTLTDYRQMIRELVLRHGRITTVAKLLKVERTTIYRILNTDSEPTYPTRIKIEELYNATKG